MFAGVGCFSILIAKTVPTGRVYSIDLNPEAFAYLQENVRLNRVFSRVIPQLGDAKDIIKTQLCGVADRVLMPLPEKALEYLPSAVAALKASGGWIHVHFFQRAPGAGAAGEKVKATIARRLTRLGVVFEFGVVREVRSIGPCLFQIVADVHVLSVTHILA
jgi:tRNA (guanine37-N1)-methyltransferase